MKSRLKTIAEKWANFFILFVLFIHSGIEYVTINIHYFNTSVFFLTYILIFFMALPYIKYWLYNSREHIFLMLVIVLALLSILWTTDVYRTFLGLVSIIGMLFIGLYLAEKYTMERVLDLLIYLCIGSLLINAVALYFFPEYSINRKPHFGIWQGLYWHKNTFGILFFLSAIIFSLALYFKRPFLKVVLYSGLLLSLWYLYRSESTTSWLAMSMFFVLFLFKWLAIKNIIQWRWIFVVLLIIVCGLLLFSDQFVALFGKNLTFSGRTRIWSGVIDIIQNNLWLGHGYSGFWYDNAHKIPHWPVGLMSHNGYLEVMVYFGIIGLFLFILLLGKALYLSGKLFFSDEMTLKSVFPFLFLITYTVQNSMESLFFLQRNLFWILFIYFVIYLNTLSHKRV